MQMEIYYVAEKRITIEYEPSTRKDKEVAYTSFVAGPYSWHQAAGVVDVQRNNNRTLGPEDKKHYFVVKQTIEVEIV